MCTFCQIIKKEIPSRKIWEDKQTLVILDTAQDMNYHLLVLPKKHIANIMECDDKTLGHLTTVIKSLAQTFLDRGFTGINLLNANGKTAGQSVEHLHFHLLLRQADDGINAWPKLPGSTISLDETYANLKINDNNVH